MSMKPGTLPVPVPVPVPVPAHEPHGRSLHGRHRTALLIAATLLTLVACATQYPLGIPEAQWQTMTTEQLLEAQAKQAELSPSLTSVQTIP